MAIMGRLIEGLMMSCRKRVIYLSVLCALSVIASACSNGASDDPDVAICEAIASLGPNPSDAEAEAVAARVRNTERPDDELLQGVQDHIGSVGNQLTLYISTFEELAAVCDDVGVEIPTPADG